MARSRKLTPTPTAKQHHSTVTTPPIAGNVEAAQFGMDVARSVLNASLNASQGVLKFMEQVQQMQAQTLRETHNALTAALGEAAKAREPQDLMTLQADLTSASLARAAQNCTSLFTRLFDAEAQFVEQAQAQSSEMTRKLMENGPAHAKGNGNDASANSPMALLNNAQAAWTQMTQQWVDAVKNGAVPH